MCEINGRTKLLAVVGRPVSHSLSPRIHNAFARHHGLPYVYISFDIGPESLKEFADAARLLGMGGFNLTMPHKERILPFLDEIDPQAQEFGAVNTVAVKDGKLKGYNTDGKGFVQSIGHVGGLPKSALVLGAGGAGKAAARALAQNGVDVAVAARRAEGLSPDIEYAPWGHAAEAARGRELLVNATPLGMRGFDDFDGFPFLDALKDGAAVCDLIYEPRETSLLRAARAKGFRAVNGIPLLVWQAALAFRHFTGVMPQNTEAVLEELSQ